MKSLTLVSFVALAVGSSASALKPRNISNNNCGRAVAGTAKGPAYQSTAKADCSSKVISYTTVTITPSASTLTLTSNVQATALATSIVTNVESTTETSDIVSTETDQYVSTAYSTSTDIETLTIVENSTPPAITVTQGVTVTAVPSSTITSYYATVSPAGVIVAAPRNIQEREEPAIKTEDDEDEECEVDIPGTASSTSASVSSVVLPTSTPLPGTSTLYTSTPLPTTSPTSKILPTNILLASAIVSSSTVLPMSTSVSSSVSGIPSYAAACTDFAQYVLACSLIGVYQTTSTISSVLPASTITVTAISTLTTTILETSSTELDLSFTTFETLMSTTTESSTLGISTATTAIITAYTTQTVDPSVVSVFQTATVTGAASIQTITAPIPSFKLQMAPASGSGTTFYLQIIGSALGYTGTTDISAGTVFTIDEANRLVTTAAAPVVACAYNTLPNYYMEAIPEAYLIAHGLYFTALTCGISGTLQVSCAYKSANQFVYVASQNSFFYATAGYNGFPTYIATAIVQ